MSAELTDLTDQYKAQGKAQEAREFYQKVYGFSTIASAQLGIRAAFALAEGLRKLSKQNPALRAELEKSPTTKIQINVDGETKLDATYDKEKKEITPKIDDLSSEQIQALSTAMNYQEGEKVEGSPYNNIMIKLNDRVLFDMKGGVVNTNELPPELVEAINQEINKTNQVSIEVGGKEPEPQRLEMNTGDRNTSVEPSPQSEPKPTPVPVENARQNLVEPRGIQALQQLYLENPDQIESVMPNISSMLENPDASDQQIINTLQHDRVGLYEGQGPIVSTAIAGQALPPEIEAAHREHQNIISSLESQREVVVTALDNNASVVELRAPLAEMVATQRRLSHIEQDVQKHIQHFKTALATNPELGVTYADYIGHHNAQHPDNQWLIESQEVEVDSRIDTGAVLDVIDNAPVATPNPIPSLDDANQWEIPQTEDEEYDLGNEPLFSGLESEDQDLQADALFQGYDINSSEYLEAADEAADEAIDSDSQSAPYIAPEVPASESEVETGITSITSEQKISSPDNSVTATVTQSVVSANVSTNQQPRKEGLWQSVSSVVGNAIRSGQEFDNNKVETLARSIGARLGKEQNGTHVADFGNKRFEVTKDSVKIIDHKRGTVFEKNASGTTNNLSRGDRNQLRQFSARIKEASQGIQQDRKKNKGIEITMS